jgi:hypothetical protein
MTIDNSVEVSGLLVDCNLYEDGKYFVHIIPDQSQEKIDEILRLADELKAAPKEQLPCPPEEDIESDYYTKYLDRIHIRTGMATLNRCSLAFESDYPPHLKGCLQDYQSNEELPRYSDAHRVRVLGKLKLMKGGNVVLHFHLVDEVPYFGDDIDDYTGSVDYNNLHA